MEFKEYMETLKAAATNPDELKEAIDRADLFMQLFEDLEERLEPEDEAAAEFYQELVEKYLTAWLEG